MVRALFLSLLLLAPAAHGSAPSPESLGAERLRPLLQAFVDREFLKAFRHLGDERDFDHGHVLHDASGRAVAILYHTQELAQDEPAGSDYGFIDPKARNWLQWVDGGAVEDASAYERREYPAGARWDYFRSERVPVYRRYGTIVDKMLDPGRVGASVEESVQVVFTRVECGGPTARLPIVLPTGERVCLSVSGS